MDTLLNELHGPSGPWIGGFFAAWGVSLIAISLWLRGASRQPPPSTIRPPTEGHIGVLYYPNGVIEDVSGERQRAGDVARKWAIEMLTTPGIICLPKNVFRYETHPLPGRVECVPTGERSALDLSQESIIRNLARRQERLEQELMQRDATITKIIKGCLDTDQRLSALQTFVRGPLAKNRSTTFEGWPRPPQCGELPSDQVSEKQGG